MDAAKLAIMCLGMLLCFSAGAGAARNSRAAVLKDLLPGLDKELPDLVAREIGRAGYETSFIEAAALCSAKELSRERFDLLVLTSAASLPIEAADPIHRFLRDGGNLIALRAPLWQDPLVRDGTRWVAQDDYRRTRAAKPPENPVIDFASEKLDAWTRASNDPNSPYSTEVVDGPGGLKALHVTVGNLTGWDTIAHRGMEEAFKPGATLTVFAARGDENTRQLLVEWMEKDQSRWIAVVPLATEWRLYVLPPEQFKFWQSVKGRGGPGDSFRPENAATFSVGLAFSHAVMSRGKHEYWIGPVGTSSPTPELQALMLEREIPPIDLLCPGYKFFPITEKVVLHERFEPSSGVPVPFGQDIYSVQPRPATGFDKRRTWRWIPVLTAFNPQAEWRGVPAAMLFNAPGSYNGAAWASFGLADPQVYKRPEVLALVGECARRMLEPLHLIDGGSKFFTYFEDQKIVLGARIANVGAEPAARASVRLSLRGIGTEGILFQHSADVDVGSFQEKAVSIEYSPTIWPESGMVASAELIRDGHVIDRIEHPVHVWRPSSKKSFVTVKDGEFLLDGKLWRPHGVNYMPSSGIGLNDRDMFEHWISAPAYDPEIVERDLSNIKRMGLNSISAFIYASSTADQNLLDLLRLCRKYELKVNLSLRPGTPMKFLKDEILGIIKYYRLWEDDTIFAYDLAWEPNFGAREARKEWDADWERWVVQHYGSIEAAEKEWGYPIPRENGKITNPADNQFVTDGEWRKMVVAYRHFTDDLLHKKYGEARRLVREIDPNHLVSFRMSEAGNPTFNWSGFLPYDFPGLAGAVDFLAPEAYGRIGSWENVKPGLFEVAYARWAAPDLPVVWAEMGVSTWDGDWKGRNPERLKFQEEFYRAFYRMLIMSRSNGVFFWWYPGGFRVNENSDYGIINPDGTDRPVTRVIKEMGPEFLSAPPQEKPDFWIEIDRDATPLGPYGIYMAVKDQFWEAVEKGKKVGLRSK